MTENEVILTELVVAEVKVLHASQLDQQLRNHRNSQIRKAASASNTQKHDCKSDYSRAVLATRHPHCQRIQWNLR